jgi:hypothetical protein
LPQEPCENMVLCCQMFPQIAYGWLVDSFIVAKSQEMVETLAAGIPVSSRERTGRWFSQIALRQ